jgi:hypothetical protein
MPATAPEAAMRAAALMLVQSFVRYFMAGFLGGFRRFLWRQRLLAAILGLDLYRAAG